MTTNRSNRLRVQFRIPKQGSFIRLCQSPHFHREDWRMVIWSQHQTAVTDACQQDSWEYLSQPAESLLAVYHCVLLCRCLTLAADVILLLLLFFGLLPVVSPLTYCWSPQFLTLAAGEHGNKTSKRFRIRQPGWTFCQCGQTFSNFSSKVIPVTFS